MIMPRWKSAHSIGCIRTRFAKRYASQKTQSTLQGTMSSARPSSVLLLAVSSQDDTKSKISASIAVLVFGLAISMQSPAMLEKKNNEKGSSSILNVAYLLDLYAEIDKKMEKRTAQLLAQLESKLQQEKIREKKGSDKSDSFVRMTPEQRALHMSLAFESALEAVQEEVFDEYGFEKEQVQEAIEKMIQGRLPGKGTNGSISSKESEEIDAYIQRLGRMRWRCTGSREPLFPRPGPTYQFSKKDDKPDIPLDYVIGIVEKLIPAITRGMEEIVAEEKESLSSSSSSKWNFWSKQSGGNHDMAHHLKNPECWERISQAYLRRTNQITASLCEANNVDVAEFQSALIYYHNDPMFEETLARLSAEQMKVYADLGL
uniref:Uncharacterized protein AlNc14C226G9212 n=1 Tax=Albugo laibachii Nc14 TaxID=890382 RepID=F0WS74_9STRA|nr:conserved hypothetical protein [Albugo laibachii Nc14]|eukprot:CCA24192.1 conserved hypothetical protein [Albugo laibachii Nc14]